jgi:hypothetical protein
MHADAIGPFLPPFGTSSGPGSSLGAMAEYLSSLVQKRIIMPIICGTYMMGACPLLLLSFIEFYCPTWSGGGLRQAKSLVSYDHSAARGTNSIGCSIIQRSVRPQLLFFDLKGCTGVN